ncbi:MAG TPA: copper chaperone PCu(A)C [Myxococcota bacterium]|nr:copper chaperone PCu(A)C [Myxococcota bacterium]
MHSLPRRRLLGCLLAACALSAQADVTVQDAWVRGVVPAQKTTGAFMTLTSTEDAKVVAARSPAARAAEIHESMVMGGVAHMHEVEALELPAGRAVALRPGGLHLMLMGLARPLKVGERVPIVLTIEGRDGRRVELEVAAEVRPIGSR